MPAESPEIPVIPPSPEMSGPRPLWSVMLPTYNRLTYLEKAIRSVLDQDPGPELMQIQVVDNCSTEVDMEAFVRKIAGERIIFSRNPENIGTYFNFNRCIALARGEWVHLLHDDDIVLPGFYREMGKGIAARPDIGAAFCRHVFIDQNDQQTHGMPPESDRPGVIDDWLDRIAQCQRIQFPAIVVKRSVYEAVGGFFHEKHGIAGDWEMWVRIAARYPVWYEPQVLAYYRMHGASGSAPHMRTSFQTRDSRAAIEIFSKYLPPDRAPILAAKARDHYAISALSMGGQLMRSGYIAYALNHAREAMTLSQSPLVIRAIEGGYLRLFEEFSNAAQAHIEQYRQNPHPQAISTAIRAIRRHLAQQWLEIQPEAAEHLYATELGKLHKIMLACGIRSQPLTEEEQAFMKDLLAGVSDLLANPSDPRKLLAGSLYFDYSRLPTGPDARRLPAWLSS